MIVDTDHPNWVKVEDLTTSDEATRVIAELEFDLNNIKTQIENAKLEPGSRSTEWFKNANWARHFKRVNIQKAVIRRKELLAKEREERESTEERQFIRLMKERYPSQSREIWTEIRQASDDIYFDV